MPAGTVPDEEHRARNPGGDEVIERLLQRRRGRTGASGCGACGGDRERGGGKQEPDGSNSRCEPRHFEVVPRPQYELLTKLSNAAAARLGRPKSPEADSGPLALTRTTTWRLPSLLLSADAS